MKKKKRKEKKIGGFSNSVKKDGRKITVKNWSKNSFTVYEVL